MFRGETERMRSQLVKDGPERSPNRSMLRAIGYTDDDFKKPFVGIANVGTEDRLEGIAAFNEKGDARLPSFYAVRWNGTQWAGQN